MFVVKRALKPAAAFGVATAFRQVRFPSPRRRTSPRRVPRIVDATIGEFHHPSFRRSRRRSSSPGSGALEPAFPRDPGAARRSSRATRRESPRHRTRSRRRSTEPLTTHLSSCGLFFSRRVRRSIDDAHRRTKQTRKQIRRRVSNNTTPPSSPSRAATRRTSSSVSNQEL